MTIFRTPRDGTTNWPAVIQSLHQVGYRGWLKIEYFHSRQHHPEALVYHTCEARDRMLGRKGLWDKLFAS